MKRRKARSKPTPQSTSRSGRNARGQFVKGVSGNPGGRPAQAAEIVEAARARSLDAIATLDEIMRTSADDSARIAAARALLDRGYGKPAQSIDLSADVTARPGQPLPMDLREFYDIVARLGRVPGVEFISAPNPTGALIDAPVDAQLDQHETGDSRERSH